MGFYRKRKSPRVICHDFLIQNHPDIFACVAIIIVAGLLDDKTSRFSKFFVFLQYGIVNRIQIEGDETFIITEYRRGLLDIFTISFAVLWFLVLHALVQEYVTDKICKRLRLSKTKILEFGESVQICVWCIISILWGIYEMYQNTLFRLACLWKEYPHLALHVTTKLYYIFQISFWLHLYPLVYLQKFKKENILYRLRYFSLHLLFISGAYVLHFWRICIVLLTLHYLPEGLRFACRVLNAAEEVKFSQYGFSIWKWLFPVVRFFSLILSLLVFWFGLATVKTQGIHLSTSCYNSKFVRVEAQKKEALNGQM